MTSFFMFTDEDFKSCFLHACGFCAQHVQSFVPETQKRSIQGVATTSNCKCNCGNCERKLLGKSLLFNLIIAWCQLFIQYLKLIPP